MQQSCYAPMKMRHPLLLGLLPQLILIVSFLVWGAPKWVAIKSYNQCSQRIGGKICSLEKRRPATVNPQLWEECVGWASTAQGNICYSEEHASYGAMCRFEQQLDEKLKEDVDLATIMWIGDRLAETGPHGQQYMANWRKQWAALQTAEQSKRR